ncbi:NlpC/P60 family protein [Sandaracinomonas limnophila]|uniref:NlpC/P60 family protein n=1 Tax=Sandaracinomonas limnophila TaxID=1862386 RepID=A0A437PWZ9_9BACT|nr:C40 family peptidase [Sandaracinomonas limnophila]RVU26759.1 NlpC/P60 family protein [Sandaracinomonas limnophila]
MKKVLLWMYKNSIQKPLFFLIFCVGLSSCGIWHKVKQFVGLEKSEYIQNYSFREINSIIDRLKTFTGVPYKTGGIDENGMDCSGLLYTSYKLEGFEIPRLSKDQSNFGLPVSIDQITIGDWIFFKTNGSTIINHAGIVTKNKGGFDITFIHSSTSKGVREDNLTNKFWNKSFVKVIRPFKN